MGRIKVGGKVFISYMGKKLLLLMMMLGDEGVYQIMQVMVVIVVSRIKLRFWGSLRLFG